MYIRTLLEFKILFWFISKENVAFINYQPTVKINNQLGSYKSEVYIVDYKNRQCIPSINNNKLLVRYTSEYTEWYVVCTYV